jgi:hypothetical protein
LDHRVESISRVEQKVLAAVLKVEFDELDRTLAQISAKEICGVTDRQFRAAVRTLLAKFDKEWPYK